MLGKNHVVANLSTAGLAGAAVFGLRRYTGPGSEMIQSGLTSIKTAVITPQDGLLKYAAVAGCFGLFVLGSMLPDIDSATSKLGRYIKVPGEHRTWTHTMWMVFLFAGLSIKWRMLTWLTLGYFLHLFYDSLSKGGVCWFWPISQYRTYQSGAKVKKGFYIKLYGTGSVQEYVLVAVLATTSILCLLLAGYVKIKEMGWVA